MALDALLRQHFAQVHIFETFFAGDWRSRLAKALRRRRHQIGYEVHGQATLPIEHLTIDLKHLANSHSFIAIAW